MKKHIENTWITLIDEPNEIFGWIGTALILIAYALLTLKIISSTSTQYQMMNLVGAIGIIWNTYKKEAFPPMILNIIWLLIASYGLYIAFM